MRQATLCLLIKDQQILLGLKKRGFGEGKWNGVGGKVQDGETLEQAAIRETQEEIGVTPKSLEKVAVLNFTFPQKPEWDQQVSVFKITAWEGEPKESEEMNPDWFDIDKIPFENMWSDDIHWMPKVLSGLSLQGNFILNSDQSLEKFEITEGSL